MAYEADGYDDQIYITIGAFDEPARLPPTAHVHVSEKIPWFEIADELPRFAGHEAGAAL